MSERPGDFQRNAHGGPLLAVSNDDVHLGLVKIGPDCHYRIRRGSEAPIPPRFAS